MRKLRIFIKMYHGIDLFFPDPSTEPVAVRSTPLHHFFVPLDIGNRPQPATPQVLYLFMYLDLLVHA